VSLLVDTKVIFELRKGSRANPHVLAWFMGAAEEEIHLSVSYRNPFDPDGAH